MAPRTAYDLGLLEHAAWRIKIIGISHAGPPPRPELVEAGHARARSALPVPAVTPHRYGGSSTCTTA